MAYEINGLGSGYAHAGQMPQEFMDAFEAAYAEQKEKAAVSPQPGWAWGIDGSYYVKNPTQVIKDAVAAGASFVLWKASDAVQLTKGPDTDVGSYVDPTFYAAVDQCYNIIRPDGKKGVPIGGYHFGHIDSEVPPFDVNSPSSAPQWRIMKNTLGLPLNLPHAPRDIRTLTWDQEGYLLSDGKTWNFQDTNNTVMSDRLKTMMSWIRAMVDPAQDPFLKWVMMYTSPGFVNSYCKDVIVDIDNRASYKLWLATWYFVRKQIKSFAEIPAMLAAISNVTLPSLGNTAEKTLFCQVGTVAVTVKDPVTGYDVQTEVDINLYKGTPAKLYEDLAFGSVPVDHSCPDGQVWSDVEGKCVPIPTGDLGQVITLLNDLKTNQTLMKQSVDEIRAHFK